MLTIRCLAAGTIIAGLFVSANALGQSPVDDKQSQLENVRRLDEIAAQKLETDVNAAYRESDQLSRTDPAQAVARLKNVLAQVENEGNLDSARRENLIRLLKVKIRFLELSAGRQPTPNGGSTGAQQRRLDHERRDSDDETIGQTLDSIRSMRLDGKHEEARALADDLARRYPLNPAVQAAHRTSIITDNLARAQSRRAELDRGAIGISNELLSSATPPARDIDFPRDWQDRIKSRTRGTPLTDKEKAILKALDSPIAVSFKGEPFENAIKSIAEKMKQPILIDRPALEEAQVKYETPVNMETPASGLGARTLLRRLLGDFGLAYVIKDQSIEVTSALKARNMMVVRSYFIGDLLNNPSLATALGQPQLVATIPGTPWWATPAANQAQVAQQVNQIIDLIKESIEPRSWGIGEGSITFHPATMSLVIRQSAEVHAILSAGLLR